MHSNRIETLKHLECTCKHDKQGRQELSFGKLIILISSSNIVVIVNIIVNIVINAVIIFVIMVIVIATAAAIIILIFINISLFAPLKYPFIVDSLKLSFNILLNFVMYVFRILHILELRGH